MSSVEVGSEQDITPTLASWRQLRGWLLRYGLAVLAVAAAYAVRTGLAAWAGPGLPKFIMFYPAVMVVALLAGFGPGLVATILAVILTAYGILPPVGEFVIASPVDRVALVIFSGVGLFMSVFAELYRRNRRKAAAYEREARDITERKRAEEQVRQSQQLLQAVIDNSQALIYVKDLEGRIIIANQPLGDALGLSIHEILGKTSRQIISDPEVGEAHMANDRRVLQTGQALTFEETALEHAFLSMKFPLRDDQGRIFATGGVSTDITDRKRAEEALHQSEEKYRSLFEHMLDGYAHCRMLYENGSPSDFVYLGVNGAFERLTGLNDVVGKKASEVIPGIARSDADLLQAYGRVAMTGRPERFETYLDSLKIWFSISVYSPAKDHFVAVFDNITDRKQAEEALRQSEEQLRLAAMAAEIGVWSWKPGTSHVTVSANWRRLFGVGDTAPVTFETWRDALHPDDRERAVNELNAASDQHREFNVEYRVGHSDGSVHWIIDRGRAWYDEQGRPVSMAGVNVDITERKRAEDNQALMTDVLRVLNRGGDLQSLAHEAIGVIRDAAGFDAVGLRLRRGEDCPYFEEDGFSEDFLREENFLCERGGDGAILRDAEGKVTLECTCGLVLSGCTDPDMACFTNSGSFWTNVSEELLALPPEADPRTNPRNRCIHVGYQSVGLFPIRSGQEIIGLLQLNDRRTGRFTPQLITFFESLAQNVGTALQRTIAQDDLRQLTAELEQRVAARTADLAKAVEDVRAERKRLFEVLETLPTMICLLTPDHHVAFANRGFRERFGESEGRHCFDYCFGLTEPCEFCESYRVLETGRPHQWEVAGPDGSVIEAHDFPFTDADGSPMILEMDIDITDRRKAEAAIRELNETLERRVAERTEELKRSNEDLQQFAYVASHDLREPLRGVTMFLELLRKQYGGQLDEKAREYIAYASDGADRMSVMIRDLLTYARVGGAAVKPVAVDLKAVADQVTGNLRATIEETHASITAGPLPSLAAEEGQMRQLFQNLIGNALKFRAEGRRPEIHVDARQEADHWVFQVRDNGIGIDPKHVHRIFDLFTRLHGVGEYPGSGIGLAICRKIVERHGGRIWVESQPGQGSAFFFTLPENRG